MTAARSEAPESDGDQSRVWVERAARGDATAVDALLQLHIGELRAFVSRRLGQVVAGKESVSDVVQSACREVLEHLDRYRFRGEQEFRRWLFATALRKLRSRRRYWLAGKRSAGREVAAETAASGSRLHDALLDLSTPSRDAARREDVAGLERALGQLPERYRAILDLAVGEGVPLVEIAARWGISEANARMIKSRAVARLATLLEEPGSSGSR